ncbi:MAG: hypothetical protein IT319_05570, partial [Anaerolineae bacterium]|nr:hypothetical protein [Anaerolineae bacterium]
MVGVLLLLVVGTVVLAQQSDGRINQTAHFGGDALYCVNKNYVPTVQYPISEGGFRLLDMHGQELWFVPAADVAKALTTAVPGGAPVLVAIGHGTYGPTSIHTYEVGTDDVYFIFNGYDEHGKSNSLTFKFCIPVGDSRSSQSPPPAATTDEPDSCYNPDTEETISCAECEFGYHFYGEEWQCYR